MNTEAVKWSRYISGILDSAVDGIIVTDREGTILAWNPGAERVYGYSAEEAVGRSVFMVVRKEQEGKGRRPSLPSVPGA